MKNNLKELLRSKLSVRNQDEIDFILNLIKESDRDANLFYMENDAFRKLKEQGLDDVFEEVCSELGITWQHNNDTPNS